MAKAKKKYSQGDKLIYAQRTCAHCGKEFYPTPIWAYKRTYGTREKTFCKYTCLTAYDREHSKAAKRAQAAT